jgi:hypothetical protein
VLPKQELTPLSPGHAVFKVPSEIGRVGYSSAVKQSHPDLDVPLLEGVSLGGVLAVVYSPVGLGTQWDGMERPYAKCYASKDALRIGRNVIVYAMTH